MFLKKNRVTGRELPYTRCWVDTYLTKKFVQVRKTYIYFLGEELKPHFKGYNYHVLLEKIKTLMQKIHLTKLKL